MKNKPVSVNLQPELLNDQNLYNLCKTYGERARLWRQKFAGLLPEVFRRKLYEKKGFESIFVFAKKLAGMSEKQVRLVLNLERKFEKTPALKSLLVNGEVSVNKLARVVSIANSENEQFLSDKVRILSKGAVETLVKDEKINNIENQKGLFKPDFDTKSLPGQTLGDRLQLSSDVEQKLLELQQKGININQLLLEFLQKRQEEIAQKKEDIRKKIMQKEVERALTSRSAEEIHDYLFARPKPRPQIPALVKKIITTEYGTKCAVPNCQKQAENIHHTLPYSIGKTHDPRFLVPLCKAHHELAHSVDMNYQLVKNRR